MSDPSDPLHAAKVLRRGTDFRVWSVLAGHMDRTGYLNPDTFTRVKLDAIAHDADVPHRGDVCRALRRIHRAGFIERRVETEGKRAVVLYRIRQPNLSPPERRVA